MREQEEEIIQAPSFAFFDYNWEDVLDWADDRLFRMNGDIDLSYSDITTLGGLVEVDGNLNLFECENLKSLGELRSVGGNLILWNCKNLQSLGELISVGGWLDLSYNKKLKSLDKLRSVGGYLYLYFTPIAETMTEDKIRKQVDIKGEIKK